MTHPAPQLPTVPYDDLRFDGGATWILHVTDASRLPSILNEGLRGPVYLSDPMALAAYYMETVEDEQDTPVLLAVLRAPLADAGGLEPDHASIAEPITTALDTTEDNVHDAWQACAGTWEDSLEIVGSVCCRDAIPASALHLVV
jgi:hypothetical protein